MRARHSWFLLLAILAGVGFSAAGGDKKDALQGKWEADKEGKKVVLTLAAKEFTLVIDSETVKGTFKADATKDPNEIDMTVTEADGHAIEGKTSLCIYELKGEMLR